MSQEILDDQTLPKNQQRFFKMRVAVLWMIPLVLYFVFKVMHWGGASVVLIFGTAGSAAYLWCGLYFLKGKNILNLVFSILALVWLLILVGGAFFNDGHPYNENALYLYGIVFAVYFLIYFLVFQRYSNLRK